MFKINNNIISNNTFADNSLQLQLPALLNQQNIIITWNYENDAELFCLICIKRHYEEQFPDATFVLHVPYLCHARMDRTERPEDVFTLKYFCEVINSLNFDEVHVLDPHSQVCVDMLNNVIVDDVVPYIKTAIKYINNPDLVIFFPDAGAKKRYESVFNDSKIAYGKKTRNWVTHKIEDYEIHGEARVSGKNVLIVDDICSYGGTFAAAADALHKAGARNIYLYITHCEENIFKGKVFENILGVYTTNSIFNFDKYHGPDGWRVIEV